ncbi:MAG TPA: hypothetical protein VIX89_05650, partial [Bryobacteraceae bacterium]
RNAVVRRLEARQGNLPVPASSGTAQKPLKLFQPAHQRYYLITTCLVCRIVGLPDRRLDTTKQERVSFVVRLLQPRANAAKVNPNPSDCDELAFIGGAWQLLTDPSTLPKGEEQNALSALTYTELDQRKRRLFMGLVPVGKREAYLAASQPKPATETGSLPPLVGTRQMLLKSQVIGPWANLDELAIAAKDVATPEAGTTPAPTVADLHKIQQRANDQIQSISWYIFLDFANFLSSYVWPVWNAISGGAGGSLTPAQQTLLTTLRNTRQGGRTLASALKNAKDQESILDSITTAYSSLAATGWPQASLIFPLAHISDAGVVGLSQTLGRGTLENQVMAALEPEPVQQPARTAAQAGANPMASPWFAIRCVVERPNCPALTHPLLSEPTAAFQLSAYFDPDAPARPIRVGLPVDTTPAGLRKFDKNTAFIMSDTLCGQVQRAQRMGFGDLVRAVLPFPFHKDLSASGGAGGPCTAGMVCSFSIPIITICALIMLIVIVKLLDIIFFWMPFFQICLPLPKFTAKGQA